MFRKKDLRNERLGLCQSTFSEEVEIKTTSDKDLDNMFWDIEKILTKETKNWWDIAGLEQYIKVDRIPRGLRILKDPTFGIENEVFMKKWDKILNDCSIKLMELIIQEKMESMKVQKQEIASMEERMKEFENSEDFKINLSVLNKKMERMEKGIRDNKARKFKRDKLDYVEGKIKDWKRKDNKVDFYGGNKYQKKEIRKTVQHNRDGNNWKRKTNDPIVEEFPSNRDTLPLENRFRILEQDTESDSDFLSPVPCMKGIKKKTTMRENVRIASPLKRSLPEDEENEEAGHGSKRRQT